jgi:hypothetical protein
MIGRNVLHPLALMIVFFPIFLRRKRNINHERGDSLPGEMADAEIPGVDSVAQLIVAVAHYEIFRRFDSSAFISRDLIGVPFQLQQTTFGCGRLIFDRHLNGTETFFTRRFLNDFRSLPI